MKKFNKGQEKLQYRLANLLQGHGIAIIICQNFLCVQFSACLLLEAICTATCLLGGIFSVCCPKVGHCISEVEILLLILYGRVNWGHIACLLYKGCLCLGVSGYSLGLKINGCVHAFSTLP